ncbi:hypothetical protein VP150E351_P0190 [Vibrio phage 150E35-1]|nr:hypothetical protein VP150E351_P0190 [Vibrio phage 150E35-1]
MDDYRGSSHNRHFWNSVKKNGWVSFTMVIDESFDSIEECNTRERNLIKPLLGTGKCYNIAPGGAGGFTSEMQVKANASRSPEAKRAAQEKAKATMGAEGMSRRAKKTARTMGSARLSERSRLGMNNYVSTLDEEGRKAMTEPMNTMSEEARKLRTKKGNETLGPEGRSARQKKAAATRAANGRTATSCPHCGFTRKNWYSKYKLEHFEYCKDKK